MIFVILSFYYSHQEQFRKTMNFDNPIFENLFLSCPKITFTIFDDVKSFDLLLSLIFLQFISILFKLYKRNFVINLAFYIFGFISLKIDLPFILFRKYINYYDSDWYTTDIKLENELHQLSKKSEEKDWENWSKKELLFSNRLKKFRITIVLCRIGWIMIISALLFVRFSQVGSKNLQFCF